MHSHHICSDEVQKNGFRDMKGQKCDSNFDCQLHCQLYKTFYKYMVVLFPPLKQQRGLEVYRMINKINI
jgi:hypothetical protein